MKLAALALAASVILTSAAIAAPVDLKPYPKASANQTQHVIQLPAMKDEGSAKLEIIVGKTMEVDCNQHFFGGELKRKSAEGWGYDYYVLDKLGVGASTLMGCPDNSKRKAFVRSSGETLVRYNSKLPVVVYTPKDVELRYRVWKAGPVKDASGR
jgi:ecotin